jgi:hypothetical protein
MKSKASLAIEHRENRFALLAMHSKQIGDRDGAWTPVQVLEHVLLTEQSIITLLKRLRKKARNIPPREPGAEWPVRQELTGDYGPGAMVVAPFSGTEPEGQLDDAQLKELGEANSSELQELMDFADTHEVSGISFPHPYVGRLNFYKWLIFSAVHERLHIEHLSKDLI